MAVILHAPDPQERLVLEEGVAWIFGADGEFPGGEQWHRMIVSGAGNGRFFVRDEVYTLGYCCEHCNGAIPLEPEAVVNEVPTATGWIRAGDVLGIAGQRWRVEIRRGAVSPIGDLFRVSPPPEALPFGQLLARFEAGPDGAAVGGLLRFAHVPARQGALAAALRGRWPRREREEAPTREALGALAIGLARVGALPDSAPTVQMLEEVSGDREMDRWLRMAAHARLALRPDLRHANALRKLVLEALEEGDAPAAVANGAETLALVLDDEPLSLLGDAARAALSDASARKRRTIALAILAAVAERDAESGRAVLRAAGDAHPQVRAAAARALSRLPDAHAGAANGALLALLCDPDDDVFEEAFAALFGNERRRLAPEALLAEVERAGDHPGRLARLTQALDRLS